MSTNICANCRTTKTPLWRRIPDGSLTCNACGLYYKANNAHRPIDMKKPPSLIPLAPNAAEEGSCKGDGHCNGTGGSGSCQNCPSFNNRILFSKDEDRQKQHVTKLEQDSPFLVACTNCGTTVTPLWRRDEAGNTICNACGLYYKLHGAHRPVKLKKSTIRRRKKTATTMASPYPQRSNGTRSESPPPSSSASRPIAINFTASFARPKSTPTSMSITSLLTEDKPIN
ncbi:hypothetical protein OGAPHI_005479 [Ogataea philodendri]|uniref:GATA-type domain-containing protein n=1 Tax=Ogataea philodendri TaxID=1378263 RepID=A0A9P8NZQ3_9ASCO|nr:uncharacterized protein OGAPHI_005479 [Ogataea philodendri]KAH3662231.1 hypothetical protein OGAPHI_005479 [Ogataea philodendri]